MQDQQIRSEHKAKNKDSSLFCQNPFAQEYDSTMCLQDFKLVEAADSFSPLPGVKIYTFGPSGLHLGSASEIKCLERKSFTLVTEQKCLLFT